jgi:hypothetical protein
MKAKWQYHGNENDESIESSMASADGVMALSYALSQIKANR